MWIEESTEGLEETIKELRNDVANLDDIAIKAEFDPFDIAHGAVELLAEVSASKITGEEERYAHIDLLDIVANVDGAEAGFESLEPVLERDQPRARRRDRGQFEAMYALLDEYRDGDGYVLYDTLTEGRPRSSPNRLTPWESRCPRYRPWWGERAAEPTRSRPAAGSRGAA